MAIRSILCAAVLVGISAFLVPVEGSAAADRSAAVGQDDLDVVGRLIVEELQQEYGLGLEDALAAVSSSGALYDFVIDHILDDRFGYLWVTYDDGFQVHLRVSAGGLEPDIAQLKLALGREVEIHEGGASWQEVHRTFDVLFKDGVPAIARADEEAGLLYVDSDTRLKLGEMRLIDPAFVRTDDAEPPEFPMLTAAAGDDYLWLPPGSGVYSNRCTAGIMFESSSLSGFSTAGHCPDGNTKVGTYYSAAPTLLQESCAGPGSLDLQMQAFQYSPSPANFARLKYPYSGTLEIYAVAGGYYGNQPTFKIGNSMNYVTGTNAGLVVGMQQFVAGQVPGSDCPSGLMTGLQTTNDADGGDSGGPVLLYYYTYPSYKHYFGGTTVAGGMGVTYSNWVPWITLPSGAHICTSISPC